MSSSFRAALLFPSLTRGSIVIPRDATASSGTSNFHHAVKAGGTSNFPHEAASNGTPWPPTQTSTCGRAPVYLRNFVFKVNSSFACLFFKLSAYFTWRWPCKTARHGDVETLVGVYFHLRHCRCRKGCRNRPSFLSTWHDNDTPSRKKWQPKSANHNPFLAISRGKRDSNIITIY